MFFIGVRVIMIIVQGMNCMRDVGAVILAAILEWIMDDLDADELPCLFRRLCAQNQTRI